LPYDHILPDPPALGVKATNKPPTRKKLFIRTVTVDLYSSCAILESLDQRKTSKDFVMTPLNSNFGMQYAPTPFMMRFGRREVLVTRDFRKRFYPVNPVIECDTGIEPGHVEVLLMRRWLLILSKAH
jgi:hypothetical protein